MHGWIFISGKLIWNCVNIRGIQIWASFLQEEKHTPAILSLLQILSLSAIPIQIAVRVDRLKPNLYPFFLLHKKRFCVVRAPHCSSKICNHYLARLHGYFPQKCPSHLCSWHKYHSHELTKLHFLLSQFVCKTSNIRITPYGLWSSYLHCEAGI